VNKRDEIPEALRQEPFSVRGFYRDHKVGILGTIAFHLAILIVFMLVDIKSAREIRELEVILEFPAEEPVMEEQEETREEYLTRMLEQQLRQSNQAVNVSKLEEEISTDKYVEEVMNELDESRSEEWREQQEAIKELLSSGDIVPANPEDEAEPEQEEFRGPTTIQYEFLESPLMRESYRLPVPVYKCKGGGVVRVNIEVDRSGTVVSAEAQVISASLDPDCLAEVALRFAYRSRFLPDNNAPERQSGKITYSFVAQ